MRFLPPVLMTAAMAALSAQAETPPSPDRLPPPVAAGLAEVQALCEPAATLRPGALSSADIDGDGAPDYLLDHAGLDCATEVSLYCGSGGCGYTLWISQNGTWARFDGLGHAPALAAAGITVTTRDGGQKTLPLAELLPK